jgi:hypothetical protein
MGYDPRTMTAALLDLAAIGWIAIGRHFDRLVPRRRAHGAVPDADLVAFERMLFLDGPVRRLDRTDLPRLHFGNRQLETFLEKMLWSRCFSSDHAGAGFVRWLVIGVPAATMALAAIFDNTNATLFFGFILCFTLAMTVLPLGGAHRGVVEVRLDQGRRLGQRIKIDLKPGLSTLRDIACGKSRWSIAVPGKSL